MMGKRKFCWSAYLLFLLTLIVIAALADPLNSPPPQPLLVDQAFPFKAWASNNHSVIVRWDIQPGYYLYRDKFQFTASHGEVELGPANFPPAVEKSNSILGKYWAYQGITRIEIPVISAFDSKFQLQIDFQGCSEKGYCYPPTARTVAINLAPKQIESYAIDRIPIKPIEQFTEWRHWKMWIGFFVLGLLISLTPCVLPMIPILSAMILGKDGMSHVRAFVISLAYVLSMALSYAVVGILLGKLGENLQAYLQKPWIIILYSLVFIGMALSLFGFYHIHLPEKLRATMARLTDRQQRGSLWGAAAMGCLSTLILSPCATPALVAILSYISASGNAGVGGLALFVVGIGMGVPLLLIGGFGRRILPKPGPWMKAIEILLGIILLMVAIGMLSRVLPAKMIMVAWSALAIGLAIYLKTFNTVTGAVQRLSKGLGLLIFVYAILLLVGAVQGATSPWQLLLIKNQNCSESSQTSFIAVKTVADVQRQLILSAGKPVLLDFYADWCVACKLMDKQVFGNAQVQKKLANVVLLRADVTANNAEDINLQRYFQVVAPPTIVMFDHQHNVLNQSKIIGEISATEFIKRIEELNITAQ